jgi:3-hydroxybutyrate dehydrogenase
VPDQGGGATALVTGSTSGIGLAIAICLAEAGWSVAFNSFTDTDEDRDLARRIGSRCGVATTYVPADLAEPKECRAVIDRTAEALGPVDILVNNAGIQHVAPVERFPEERWNAILALNLSAAFHTISAAIPHMVSSGWGRIINIASVHGLSASPYKAAYVSAKHGLVGLTKTVALETAENGITCNAICPGYVLTPLVEAQIHDQTEAHGLPREAIVRDVMLARQPTKRFVTPERVGALARFLCTADADDITGSAIAMDGGWGAL